MTAKRPGANRGHGTQALGFLRIKVEQAIAWGETPEEITGRLPVAESEIARILDNMDKGLNEKRKRWTDETGERIREAWEYIPQTGWTRRTEGPENCSTPGPISQSR